MRRGGGLGQLTGTAGVLGEMAIGERLMREGGGGGRQVSRALGPDAVGDPTLSPRRAAHLPSPRCSQSCLQRPSTSPCT